MGGRQLRPWRGGRDVDRLRHEMDTLFERFFREPFAVFAPSVPEAMIVPEIDVSETEVEVVVRCELPGVEPQDVDINVSGDVLTIRGEKKVSAEEQKENFHLMERDWGRFSRSVMLPQHVQPEKVAAHYKNGILKIVLPKAAEARARKIEIKAE